MLARVELGLVDFAKLAVGSVRFLAVGAERNGVHASSSLGIACVAFVDGSGVSTCTNLANVCVGASGLGVAKSLTPRAL